MKKDGPEGYEAVSASGVGLDELFFTAQDQDNSHDEDNTDEKIQINRHVRLLSQTIRISHLLFYIPQMTANID
jgi:hypothetical protein